MFDTVVCSLRVINVSINHVDWTGSRTVYEAGNLIEKYWLVAAEDYQPKVNYLRSFDGDRIRLEFSIPKMARLDLTLNPSPEDVRLALDRATDYARQILNCATIPHVSEWRCHRIDYSWNWRIQGDITRYMMLVQRLHLARTSRQAFGLDGIIWKQKGKRSRWVKFYDKGIEQGRPHENVLRYEVSNLGGAVSYMCRRWFGCDQIVSELLHEGRSLFCMMYVFQALGLLGQDVYVHRDNIKMDIQARYGASAPLAWWVMEAVREHGTNAYKSGLVRPATFYKYKSMLVRDGFLSDSDVRASLPALVLPVVVGGGVYAPVEDDNNIEEDANIPQNLGNSNGVPRKHTKKIRQKFGLKEGWKLPKWLIKEI